MMYQTYRDTLNHALQSGPEWPAAARLHIALAVAFFIQQKTMQGVPYGSDGMPNMQTILEIGAVPAEEFERFYKPQITEWVHEVFLPYLKDMERNAVYLDPKQFAH